MVVGRGGFLQVIYASNPVHDGVRAGEKNLRDSLSKIDTAVAERWDVNCPDEVSHSQERTACSFCVSEENTGDVTAFLK